MTHHSSGPHCPLVWLHHAPSSRADAGGKGASLSQLAALGAPVPNAFALTTQAWRWFAISLGLPRRARDVNERDLPRVRADIMHAPLPDFIAEAISDGYLAFQTLLGDELALAVRSSATAEDSASFSFAGLHDTILDVRTPTALESAIRQCWASLWSDRAYAYRMANGFATATAEIAVIVQQLVRSDVSFVAFTTDPIHDRDDHLVITATWGLGEAIVSGLVVPDQAVVGPDGSIMDYTIGGKHLMVIPGSGADEGTREVAVPRVLRSMPVLSREQVAAIATMARSLSSRLGYEADLEGGFADGSLYLFLARPITTIAAQPLAVSMRLEEQLSVSRQ